MKKTLTGPAAWREVARRIAENGMIGAGICQNVTEMFLEGRIPFPVYRKMRDQVVYHLGHTAFFADRGDPEPRIYAALLLALDTEDGDLNDGPYERRTIVLRIPLMGDYLR